MDPINPIAKICIDGEVQHTESQEVNGNWSRVEESSRGAAVEWGNSTQKIV